MIFIAGIMLVLGQGMVTAYSPSYYSSKTTTKYPYWSTSDIWPGEADISGSVGPQRVKLCSGYQHEHDCDNQTVIFHVDQWREDSNQNRFSPFGEKIALPVPCKFKFWPHCQNPKSTSWPKTTTNGYKTTTHTYTDWRTTTTTPWPTQIDIDRDSTGKPSRRTTRSTTRGHKTTTSRGHVTTTRSGHETTTRRGHETTTRNSKMDCWKMTCQYAITHLDDLEVKAHATIYKPSGHWPVGKTQDLQDGRMKILATTKYFGGSLDAHVRKDTEPNGFRISGNFKLHSKPMLAADEP